MSNYLPTDYQSFIALSRYAKYYDGEGRENWGATVGRYMLNLVDNKAGQATTCLLYTSPSPRDGLLSRMPSSA